MVRKKTMFKVIMSTGLCGVVGALIPVLANAADWPGVDEGDFYGSRATTDVFLKMFDTPVPPSPDPGGGFPVQTGDSLFMIILILAIVFLLGALIYGVVCLAQNKRKSNAVTGSVQNLSETTNLEETRLVENPENIKKSTENINKKCSDYAQEGRKQKSMEDIVNNAKHAKKDEEL